MQPQNNNPYNQYPQGEQMPPFAPIPPQMGMPMRPRRRMTWRERMMHRFGMDTAVHVQKGAMTIPNWITGRSMVFFFVAMFACWSVFGYVPAVDLWMVSAISVILFFYGGATMSRSWAHASEKRFLRNVFIAGFIVRILWAFYGYFFFNMDHYGHVYGDDADSGWYMDFAKDFALWLKGDSKLSISQIVDVNSAAIDDTGYPMWLAVGYAIWGEWSDVAIPFIIKGVVGAYCAISIYHVTKRHFGIGTARLAAIFVALNPNMIYWCGNMFKEAEMMFLCCLCVDLVDRALTSGTKLTFKTLLPGVLVAMYIFFFRAALGIVFFLAIFAHIVMASGRVMSAGKKMIAGVMVGIVLLVGMGDRIRSEAEEIRSAVQSDQQDVNMEWRAKREGGNSFAAYASKTVFAPLIFTIPFPTFNQANEGQILQMQLSGGNYIKNICSFFVILLMVLMLVSGEWRRHVFILAYTLGYLMTLVLSNFAQSGRFHMPIWPMLMLFAAYGIQISKSNPRYRRWFVYALAIEFVACLAWNWFKLKGRGMI